MIEIVDLAVAGERTLRLTFSDGATALWSADAIIERATLLTTPLADPDYFARAFIEAGALAWPNGLEFSGHALHRSLAEAGALIRRAA